MNYGAVHGNTRASFKISLKLLLLIIVTMCIPFNHAKAKRWCSSDNQCEDGLVCCSDSGESQQYCHECCDNYDKNDGCPSFLSSLECW